MNLCLLFPFIKKFLSIEDLVNLRQTCKYLYKNIKITHIPEYQRRFYDNFKYFIKFFPFIEVMNCSRTKINFEDIRNLPLKKLDISYTDISGRLPDTIVELNCQKNLQVKYKDFAHLKLIKLNISCTNISGRLPDTIIKLNCHYNPQVKYKDFAHLKLKKLDISYTDICGRLPDTITDLNCENNQKIKYRDFAHLKLIKLNISYTDIRGRLPRWIMIRAFGVAKRMPFAPAVSSNEPIDAAWPMQSVATFGLMYCMVS